MASAAVVQGTCARELEHYADATLQVEREIEATQQEIEGLHVRLQQQRQQKKNKAECEALARVVNAHRPRAALEADVRALEGRLEKIEEEAALASGAVSMRQRQVRLLLASLQELKSLWEEDGSSGKRGARGSKASGRSPATA